MPPVPLQSRPLSSEDPSLSDEDVGLLYQIVSRAEEDPEVALLPYRVLFKVYDEVIAEHGVDADPGYACMRFLFKMGSKNVVGDTLFEKFETLLEQMGIVLEIGEYNEGNETFTENVPSRSRGDYSQLNEDTSHTTRRRRASFSSVYDIGDGPTERSFINRPSSRSSLSRLETGKPEFLEPRRTPHPATAATGDTEPFNRTQLIAQFIDVGRRLIDGMDSSKKNKQPEDEPPSNGVQARSAVDRDRSQRIAEARSLNSRSRSSKASDEDVDDSSTSSQGDSDLERPQVPLEMLYRPSLSDLLRDASTFNMYRQRAINRRIITQWLKKAIQARQSHRHMEVVAVNRDRLTLLRQAFQTWLSDIQKKRRAVQTERFFKHLEERAGRARDLFLVTKAFTHWAQVASDEVAKTSAARKHILSVKYFNAWREITAVNELKAQRFGLRRPFNIWKKKVHEVKQAEEEAATFYDKKTKHDGYWKLFWCFCERRAPQWYDFCLKRRALLYWLRKFRTNRERIHEIDVENRRFALGSALQILSQKSKAIVSSDQRAVSMQRRQLLEMHFHEWRVQSRLAPAASRVSGMVDNHILQASFTQWAERIQMLKQAEEFDRRRVMRNSWTIWNDLLRCQALTARIEERLKMETMYKWILAERFRLMQRIRDQRISRDVFSNFVTNVRKTYSRLLDHAEIHEEHQNKETLRSRLLRWRDQTALQRQREFVAFEFYAPRLLEESLVAWRSKHQQVIKLETWARNAHFYFVTKKSIKRWHTATLDSTKRRRQDAYAKTRRMIKINLAAKALTALHDRASHVANLEQQALQFRRRKLLDIAFELLAQWHEKTAKQIQDCHDADLYHFRQAAYRQLIHLAEALVQCQTLEQQADRVYHVHMLGQANSQLRKLSLRVFQIKSTLETADSMRERSLRRHSRSMFRHWVEKARLGLEARDLPGPLSPSKNYDGTSGVRTGPSIFDPWERQIETPFKVTDFVPDSQPRGTTPLLTPNYLTSPSKRAARARTLAQVSTTPATPLQTPFASRLLRAGITAPRTNSSRRAPTGRGSSMATSVRFVDEEPESPTEGRRSGNRRP
ncbi:Sfi1 spindle body protein-domain-containing protein [Aspergillus ambiguus]|uniref:Sfi1 family protein n=1 Tax=Aspergillus ambiguus TaxID=176160 RepID=UPI003CCD4AB2